MEKVHARRKQSYLTIINQRVKNNVIFYGKSKTEKVISALVF